MPAVLIVDKVGQIRYQHYGESMGDIPLNQEVLNVLDRLNREQITSVPASRFGK
jgi:peroxiredoxin Q/BCP